MKFSYHQSNSKAFPSCRKLRKLESKTCSRNYAMKNSIKFSLKRNTVLGELEELSSEDKQFTMMMKNGAGFANGLYQLPLPLTNPALVTPNNKTMVEKKLFIYLKKLFMKNKKFLRLQVYCRRVLLEWLQKYNHMARLDTISATSRCILVHLNIMGAQKNVPKKVLVTLFS